MVYDAHYQMTYTNNYASARSLHVLTLSAATQTALRESAADLAAHLKSHPELPIADVAFTLHMTPVTHMNEATGEYRWFAVCRDACEAIRTLETVNEKQFSSVNSPAAGREVAYLFPGLGEQYVELARALYRDEPAFRATVQQCNDILRACLNLDLREIFMLADTDSEEARQASAGSTFDFRAFVQRSGHDTASPFAQPEVAHPATFILEYALSRLLGQWGILPSAMLGYSLGEYVAACLAGVFSLEDALVLVATRARMLQDAPKGAMLAVNITEKDVSHYLSDEVSLAAVSSPNTCILAGSEGAIARLRHMLMSGDIMCQPVTATHAFHTPMLNPLRGAVVEVVRTMHLSSPRIPYISNVTGDWIADSEATNAEYWAAQMCQTVHFADGVQRLLESADRFVLEVGPGRSLSSFVKQHPSCGMKRMALVQATLPAAHERHSCQFLLLQTLGKLWQAGVAIDWTGFHADERRHYVPLPGCRTEAR